MERRNLWIGDIKIILFCLILIESGLIMTIISMNFFNKTDFITYSIIFCLYETLLIICWMVIYLGEIF